MGEAGLGPEPPRFGWILEAGQGPSITEQALGGILESLCLG